MKIYLAGTNGLKKEILKGCVEPSKFNVLESYYSIQEWQLSFIPKFKNFLLDSGAFTFRQAFINKRKNDIDWEQYTREYGLFVKKYDIKQFFEMDIDNIIDYSYVKKLRHILENNAERKCIPVWHVNRGKDDFIETCNNYPYIAIGGLVGKNVTYSQLHKIFPWFINTAHNCHCKIHGLGFTSVTKLPLYHFDSVDSTTWLNAGRFGELHQFCDGKIIRHGSVNKFGKYRSLKTPQNVALHNFCEWGKFNQYAELYL